MERGRKYRQINNEMRKQIAEMYGQNYSIREIALEMKMNQSSVCREINRGLTDELDESGPNHLIGQCIAGSRRHLPPGRPFDLHPPSL